MNSSRLIVLLFISLGHVLGLDALASGYEKQNLPQLYLIESDTKDKSIPKGHFVVEGTVRLHSSNTPLSEAEVNYHNPIAGKTVDIESVITDSMGNFQIKLPTGIEQFCADHALFTESCIANYEFKDQHRVRLVIFLTPNTKHVKRKPLIYLYNEGALDVSLQLDPYGDFTFTYPQYENGWNVHLDETGALTLQDADRHYPYLFWEAESDHFQMMSDGLEVPGFFIQTDSTISFLENALNQLNFNQTEKTDFITFWAPIIEREPYALIQFIVDEDYDQRIAKLTINPQPDRMKRVYIVVAGMESSFNPYRVIPQQLTSFERTGFTLLEWGGGTVDLKNLRP